jgi:Chemotaxis protein histidine kinase and related kinases
VTISAQQQELVDLLRNELAEIISGDFSPLANDDSLARIQCLEEAEVLAENIGNAARLVGLSGVASSCEKLIGNFQVMATITEKPAPLLQQLVQSWGVMLLGYLQYIGDELNEKKAADALLQYLADPAWPQPLNDADAATLAEQFQQTEILLDETAPQYPAEVTEAMTSLAVGEDINPELLRGLLVELPNQVSAFERAVEQYLIMEDDVQLRIAQRIAHTLKGAANVVGIQGIANLTHFLEDLLELSAKQTKKEPRLGFLLQDAADCLSAISEFLVGVGPRPSDLLQVMESVLELLRDSAGEGESETPPARSNVVPFARHERTGVLHEAEIEQAEGEIFDQLLSVAPSADSATPIESTTPVETTAADNQIAARMGDAVKSEEIPLLEDIYHRPVAPVSEIRAEAPKPAAQLVEPKASPQTEPAPPAEAQETFDTTLNISESQAQELLRLSGESQIGNTQILSRLDVINSGVRAAEAYHSQLRQLAQDLERLLELQTAMASAAGGAREEEMDPLELERYNELNSFASQLHEVTTDAHEAFIDLESEVKSLKNLVLNQRQLGFDSQELLLNIRMLPVSVFSSRFQRCVRQAARLTGKSATLEIKGEEVLADSRVLTTLVDPIMHLLRNAVDHGLENSGEERAAAGKPPAGRITLEFSRAGDTVVVQCRDDGRGIDYEAIAEAAVERGIAPRGTRLGIADLNALILSAGFTTRREVTQTSGRGVGLDVVNDQIRLLKGNLSINSQRGRGTTFTLIAPMSILSAHTLVVQVGEHRVSVISRALEQVVYLEPERLEKRADRLVYRLQGEEEPLPVFLLDDLIFMNTRRAERHTALMVLRNRDGRRCGVLAETIKSSEEQIIKPLSRSTFKVPGVIGATILGDGRVSPVVDLYELPGLSLDAGATWRKRFEQRLRHLDNDIIKERPIALVVDDSLSARRSLAQFVGDMGMEVYTAKDGFEAIQIIQQRIPSVILVDLEMPRMNGLELTSHLRANDDTKDIPIIMITSRATEKHRSMAARVGVNTYLNKPWTDEELLSSIQSQIA